MTPGAAESPLAVGQPAPPFVTSDLNGTAVALQEYQGRAIILNFWATWCVPCRQEMPILQEAQAAHGDKGLVILALSQDDHRSQEVVRTYVHNAGLTLRTLLDADGKVASLYHVFLLPSTVFINAAGTVTAVHLGPVTHTQMEQYLTRLLAPQE
jgi:cytochrome c biogenesis protein CcmG/thiol:disulfide interchange protein DsbE